MTVCTQSDGIGLDHPQLARCGSRDQAQSVMSNTGYGSWRESGTVRVIETEAP